MFESMVQKLAAEFGFLKEELPRLLPPGVSSARATVDAENSAKEFETKINTNLDRSEKLDEVDTITFGLETDDGKIVKVYVNAEQADDFEAELAQKLGELDDIGEVLNELSKNFEIVDVEWPDEDEESGEDGDDGESVSKDEDDGSSALNQDVYNNKNEKKDHTGIKPKFEGLEFGDRFALKLFENDPHSIEDKLTTPTQLMVWHALLDLGIPDVALNKSPYRGAILKGIKSKAEALSKNTQMKKALKLFISQLEDFNDEEPDEEPPKTDAEEKEEKDQPKDDAPPPKKKDDEAVPSKKDADSEIEEPPKKDDNEEDPKKLKKKDEPVKEAKLFEKKLEWSQSFDNDGNLKLSCTGFSVLLDDEQVEKLLKGLANRDLVIVRDADDPTVKVTFSPRGAMMVAKKLKTSESFTMEKSQVRDLIDFIEDERKPSKKKDEEANDKESNDDKSDEEPKNQKSKKSSKKEDSSKKDKPSDDEEAE
jgi:hypothetical protein